MDMVEILKTIKQTPGILQKDVISGGANHRAVMTLLRQGAIRREWSGYGYKLFTAEKTTLKLQDYVRLYVRSCSSNGLKAGLHGEKFRQAFDKCYGLEALK